MEKVVFQYKKGSYSAYDAHARAEGESAVGRQCKFESDISIGTERKRGNAKSIVGLISMQFVKGEEYYVTAEGRDAAKAASAIAKFISTLAD